MHNLTGNRMNNLFYINKKLFLVIYLFFICITNCISQEVIASSAGYSETASLSLSWTIGENFTETFSNNDIILTQGFNQGNIIITDISEMVFPEITIAVYPNPVKEYINIRMDTKSTDNLKAEIFSMSGMKLLSESINSNNTGIDIQRLPASDYILRLSNSDQVLKSFKIVKTD